MTRVWTSVQRYIGQVNLKQPDRMGISVPQLRELIAYLRQELFGDYPGLEVFSADSANDMLTDMVRGRLTQSLSELFLVICPVVWRY